VEQMKSKSTGPTPISLGLKQVIKNYIEAFNPGKTLNEVNEAEKALSAALILRSGQPELRIGLFVNDLMTDIRKMVISGSTRGVGKYIVAEVDRITANLAKADKGPRPSNYPKME
jgi:hypothetical protein